MFLQRVLSKPIATVIALGGLTLTILLAACAPAAAPTEAPTAIAPPAGYANAHLLVETDWLAANLNAPNLRIIDVRTPDKYSAGHISNAVNLPLSQVSIKPDPQKPVTNELISKERLEGLLGALGVGNDTKIVIYDEGRSTSATRVFWTLEYYGHQDKVAVLNGGYTKWEKEGKGLAQESHSAAPSKFVARVDLAKLAKKDFVQENLKKTNVQIIDSRSPKEYSGEDVRAARGGRVPGAFNVDWVTHYTEGDAPVFKSAGELAALYAPANLNKDKKLVAYCQSGMRSSNAYFVLRLLGYADVANYDGSWEEWGNDPATPIEL